MRNYFSLQRYQIKFIIIFTEFTSKSILERHGLWVESFGSVTSVHAGQPLGSTTLWWNFTGSMTFTWTCISSYSDSDTSRCSFMSMSLNMSMSMSLSDKGNGQVKNVEVTIISMFTDMFVLIFMSFTWIWHVMLPQPEKLWCIIFYHNSRITNV